MIKFTIISRTNYIHACTTAPQLSSCTVATLQPLAYALSLYTESSLVAADLRPMMALVVTPLKPSYASLALGCLEFLDDKQRCLVQT
jgi:hypothetical protein